MFLGIILLAWVLFIIFMVFVKPAINKRKDKLTEQHKYFQEFLDSWSKPKPELDAILQLTPSELSNSTWNKLEAQWKAEHPSEVDTLRAEISKRDELISSKSALIAKLNREIEAKDRASRKPASILPTSWSIGKDGKFYVNGKEVTEEDYKRLAGKMAKVPYIPGGIITTNENKVVGITGDFDELYEEIKKQYNNMTNDVIKW